MRRGDREESVLYHLQRVLLDAVLVVTCVKQMGSKRLFVKKMSSLGYSFIKFFSRFILSNLSSEKRSNTVEKWLKFRWKHSLLEA